MALPLFKTEQLKRYKDIIALLIKYGRSDLVKEAGLSTPAIRRESLGLIGKEPQPEELASDLENLGATFIKLGQLLSTRGDLLPEPYLDALARLQDKVEPFSFEEVDAIVSSELGIRISKAFAEFDPEPLAAASLAQVHRAWMRDGRAVVVKVQRPGVREQIVNDLEALEEVASFIDAHTEIGKRYEFVNMLEDLRRSLLREIDFQREGNNLIRLGDSLSSFKLIVIPEPIDDFTTSRVLTRRATISTACPKSSGRGCATSSSSIISPTSATENSGRRAGTWDRPTACSARSSCFARPACSCAKRMSCSSTTAGAR